MKKRYYHIDFLRAFSILGVIVIHVYTQNLTNSIDYLIWNYLQFVVIAFVFCSGYVTFERSFSLIRRLLRLIIPFYLYFAAHLFLFILFPSFFQSFGVQKSFNYIIQSVFLYGGVGVNWLPLLFLELSIFVFTWRVLPIKVKSIYVLAAIAATVYFTSITFPYNFYRWVMWIPWSLVFLFAGYVYRKDKKESSNKIYFIWISIFTIVYTILLFVFVNLHKNIYFINNKYPPNLFYLSYGICVTLLLGIAGRLKIWSEGAVGKTVLFVSKYSYSIFFIHFIFLDITLTKLRFLWHLNVLEQILFVTFSALLIRLLLNGLQNGIHYSSLGVIFRKLIPSSITGN